MNRKEKQQFYVPSTNSTKYEFLVAGASEPITIIREEQWFYQVEQDGRKKPLGDMAQTCKYLYRCQAQWLTKENRRKRMFYSKDTAVQMTREGYTVVHVESGNRLSYTEDFSRIVCSSSIVLDNDLPPGNFCIDFTESKLDKTYNEVKADKLLAKTVEEQKQKEKENEARREAVRVLFERNRDKQKNSNSTPKPEPVEDNSSSNIFLKVAGLAAVFLLGFGAGKFFN